MSTDIQALIARLRELEAQATKGPWTYQERSDVYTHILRSEHAAGTYVVSFPQASRCKSEEDARFTAAARNAMPTLLDAIAAQAERIEELERDAGQLKRFAGLVLEDHRNGGYPGDVDGGALQSWAEQCGLIKAFTADSPCGEGCACAEGIPTDEFPTQCYRNTELGKAVIDAAQAGSKEKT